MATHPIVVIPGDGIGPEVTIAVQRILQAAHAPVEWMERQAGIAALEAHGEVLPTETVGR
jgi:isocitrate dehydrogenase (NAD+)